MKTLTKYRLGYWTAFALAVVMAIVGHKSPSWYDDFVFMGLMLTACILFTMSLPHEPPSDFPY